MTDLNALESLYFAALEKTPAERPAFLDAACGTDADLRARVERLLAAQPKVGGFLAAAPPTATFGDSSATANFAGKDEHVGAVLGGKYKLVEEIGEGGMGSVFMAQQTEPVKRAVAVKVIKAGMDSKAVLARFEAERQALAMMDHPNIARVLDAGSTESGRPFFVMELVKGVPITQFCDERKLTPRQRLELFVPVCQAIQHAHQKGVIHRDIKPNNVLVALYDDNPVPKVIDFGVAKAAGSTLTDRTLMTGFGAVVGTPEYMSPEQASLNNLDIDTRSDVYSLGVLLYELLTGSTPVDRKSLGKAALLEVLRIVREVEAPKPSAKLSTIDTLPSVAANRGTEPAKLGKLMKGELDWLVLKALEKDRTRRYDTVNALSRDIQRYLADEVVEARPPSAGYRLKKFVRRHKGQVIAASLVLFALLAGIAGTTLGLFRANAEAANARAAEMAATAAEAKAVAREAAEKKARETADAVAGFMQDVFVQASAFHQASRGGRTRPGLTVKEAMDHAARSIEGRFADRPEIEAALRYTIGKTYWELGSIPEAEPQLKAAYQGWETIRGPDHPDTLKALYLLADLHFHRSDYVNAEPLWKRLVAGREKALGANHPETFECVLKLIGSYYRRDGAAAAEPLLQRAVAEFEASHGPDHRLALDAKNELARMCASRGEYAQAEKMYQQTLAARRRVFGEDNLDTLESIRDLGILYTWRRNYEEAERYTKRALQGYEKILGPDQGLTLQCGQQLGLIYTAKREFTAAEPLLKRALAGLEIQLGPEHPWTLRCLFDLADFFAVARRQVDAIPVLEERYRAAKSYTVRVQVGRRLYEVYLRTVQPVKAAALTTELLAEARKTLPKGDPELTAHLVQIARAHRMGGHAELALPFCEEAVAANADRVAPRTLDAVNALFELAFVYRALGRHTDAVPLYERVYKLKRNAGVEDVRWEIDAENHYGVALLNVGRYADAELRLLGSYRAALDTDGFPADWLNAYHERLATLYASWGKPAEAAKWRAEWVKRAVAQARQGATADSPQLAGQLAQFGLLLLEAGDFAEAEPLLRECLAIRGKTQPDDWRMFNTQSMLGGALLGQKKYADAEPLLLKGYEGMKAREKTIPPQAIARIPEALDRLVDLHTATKRPDEVKMWRAERAKYPNVAPPPRAK